MWCSVFCLVCKQNLVYLYVCTGNTVHCLGLYDRKYAVLHNDIVAGGTHAKKLWEDGRKSNISYAPVNASDHREFVTTCTCCATFIEWKKNHPVLAKQLQLIADQPVYYQLFPNEAISFSIGDQRINYKGTIRALSGAPLGECTKAAKDSGAHPYTCDACNALAHGKSSVLNRRLQRNNVLKHPRSEDERALKSGVNHKFCSADHLHVALQSRKIAEKMKSNKITSLTEANIKLLHSSWHNHKSMRPFIEMLITLMEENRLTDFDTNFIKNWIGKKAKGKFFRADEQARNLAVLYSNKLGERMYTITAPIMGLPCARQAKRITAKERDSTHYLPGLNEWAFEKIKNINVKRKPLQNGMDGTRVVRTIELYLGKYLIGKAFPPDIRLFPDCDKYDISTMTNEDIQRYIFTVRKNDQYAPEAYSFNFSDTTGEYPDVLVGSIPESKSGVTGECILGLMFEVEKLVSRHDLPLIGHCTDSASNSLSGLMQQASPDTYTGLDKTLYFIGLSSPGFRFYAPVFRAPYPSIAYPCWDHSGRTVVRNLMNTNITIVCGILPNSGDGMQCYQTACIQDLATLKSRNPKSLIRHTDINRHIKQNCDATTRILTTTTIQQLAEYVPESKGTQLYLRAAVWTHEPYRNDKFGPPTKVCRSLWAGLMTWRRWYRYIQITPELTLTYNFISRSHYMTEELLVHAGINHQLALFFAFHQLPVTDDSLRHTGNRGIEAIHGIFRGGAASLPITAPNLSFREFLSKMNSTAQIHTAEHNLKQIDGHSIVASKKKRQTSAKHSTTDTPTDVQYTFPSTYEAFCKQLDESCKHGDDDSKAVISELAPYMAAALKKVKEWDNPILALSPPPPDLKLVTVLNEKITPWTEEDMQDAMDSILGTTPEADAILPQDEQALTNADIEQAYANYVMDGVVTFGDDPDTISVNTLLKGMQPYREKPSKDRSRRFATGDLPFDSDTPESHDVQIFQYWTVFPTNKLMRAAKVFLLGQVIYLSESSKPVRSSIKVNPSLSAMLNVYEYQADSSVYTPAGKSGLIKTADNLHLNVSHIITSTMEGIQLDHMSVPDLIDYKPPGWGLGTRR